MFPGNGSINHFLSYTLSGYFRLNIYKSINIIVLLVCVCLCFLCLFVCAFFLDSIRLWNWSRRRFWWCDSDQHPERPSRPIPGSQFHPTRPSLPITEPQYHPTRPSLPIPEPQYHATRPSLSTCIPQYHPKRHNLPIPERQYRAKRLTIRKKGRVWFRWCLESTGQGWEDVDCNYLCWWAGRGRGR